jgi:REP element-mobilizing transposase RayT
LDVFRSEKTKQTFLDCLGEACEKTGWRVHAWCLMSNHYHLAVSTPEANLVEGMRWLQGMFAARFNRMRTGKGRIFPGRYKSLIVDPDGGLGPLCHYIHLNPVRTKRCAVSELASYWWTSLRWLNDTKCRPKWYDPTPGLNHAGGLADTLPGRRKYGKYLEWLAKDETAQKQQRLDSMSKGWVIGTRDFTKAIAREHRGLVGRGRKTAARRQVTLETAWQECLKALLRKLRRKSTDFATTGKSEEWKLAIASVMKSQTTATNRWLSATMHLGNMYEASRKVSAWTRQPDVALLRKLS